GRPRGRPLRSDRDARPGAPRGGALKPARTRSPATAPPSQRVEERDEGVLVRGAQVPVVEDDERRLARVAEDRLVAAEALAIVHQAVPRAQAPERRRPDLVARRLPAVLDDPVTGADVVQQEIAE